MKVIFSSFFKRGLLEEESRYASISPRYQIEDETLYVLGLVHERRHPDYLRENLEKEKG